MDQALKAKILTLLEQHRIMTVATVRPDGWPQATTVGYASEGLTLYFLCGLNSQKAKNLALDNRLSFTVDHGTENVMQISGLSMAAYAEPVTDHREGERIIQLLAKKYDAKVNVGMVMPPPDAVRLFRVTPIVISVLDYSKGFAHTDLVEC
ncbi:pyridoxamine 5'-phosphate oxidase family protein [Sphingobium subterraneum]|uniref:Nitroimidazol reductase NimA-like FMN-containing flavoprotein (Pyridoxamine 5'-phosphate oxidase superfamily) n=1 Tax=Sphingobium subterraneum TaxID=627688 RepID=A0A841IX35_9SPHN|nr:pyridoxamine 5'-phosphate oxidase family protein [Sphingobium subterraneum]MBB6123197.1 nitroimidazol reductase NimA-like FMN-containing flavoprotein (pyridoxamine 5'-phosphate oxidase superfamily) [Sphingobium subterraneum]